MLLAYGETGQIEDEVRRILSSVSGVPHVFNLGHGILPQTPIGNLLALIKAVRTHESRKYSG
jgi:uroporphyrinogen decarboxylase